VKLEQSLFVKLKAFAAAKTRRKKQRILNAALIKYLKKS
jgi:hypothetical protein